MCHIFRTGHRGCRDAAPAASFRPCKGPENQAQGKGASDSGHSRLPPWVRTAKQLPPSPRAKPERAKALCQHGGEGIEGSGARPKLGIRPTLAVFSKATYG
jgi:hypothetical protein